jgi:restriction system protein
MSFAAMLLIGLLACFLHAFLQGKKQGRKKSPKPQPRQWAPGEHYEAWLVQHLQPFVAQGAAVFHDVTLEVDGQTTQIDLVVVTPARIFVVEAKDLSGTIYGRKGDKRWTQRLGRKSFTFQNPLRQNYAHVCALQQTLGLSDEAFCPVVVFSGYARFAKPVEGVLLPPEFFALVDYVMQAPATLNVTDIALSLSVLRLPPTEETRQRHLDSLRERQAA